LGITQSLIRHDHHRGNGIAKIKNAKHHFQ